MTEAFDLVPLIRTKLYPPSRPGDCLTRKRLTTLLDGALEVPLTILSAPAGYGKSVLACEWIETLQHPAVWYSLDYSDSDLQQFTAYLQAAVDSIKPGALAKTSQLLQASEPAPLTVLAAHLINDIDQIDRPLVVVLDDCNRLDNDSPVTALLNLLLEHPPPNLHLVILTRRDLPLPLGRLRAGNQLLEIRLQDLRFDEVETASLLSRVLSVSTSEAALHHLMDEVEGWPVGLRLVSLVAKQSRDPEAMLSGLHGGIPQIQEYLLQEVLDGLPDETTEGLLRSSILNRFSAEMIDAVCVDGEKSGPGLDGNKFIAELRRSNLFAYSLDSQGQWYRYHHWFQYMLKILLEQRIGREKICQLHRRAGKWLEANDQLDEALTHYLASDRPELAVDLIARNVQQIVEMDHWFVVDRWLHLLPEDLSRNHANMQLARAWVGFCKLDITVVAECIERVESLMTETPLESALTCQMDFLRGWLAYWSGDLVAARERLEQARSGFSTSPGMIAGELLLYLSFAMGMSGDYTGAERFLAQARVAAGGSAGGAYLVRIVGASGHLGYLSGRIDSSAAAVERVRVVCERSNSAYGLVWVHYLAGLQYFSRGLYVEALACLHQGEKRIQMFERRAAADFFAIKGISQQLLGESNAASATLAALEQFVNTYDAADCVWVVESVAARLQLLRGETEYALNWARSVVLPEVGVPEVHLWASNPATTRARILVQAGDTEDVERGLGLLDGLLEQYQAYHNFCQIIDLQPLRAIALVRLGDADRARDVLEKAIGAAAPGGWIRPFAEPGAPILELLQQLQPDICEADFLHRVEDGIRSCVERARAAQASETVRSGTISRNEAGLAGISATAEELTNRELDILEFLDQRLQNKEIASRLFISPHTVGYHLKHIYQKLDVNGRRQAVKKARVLGILPSRLTA